MHGKDNRKRCKKTKEREIMKHFQWCKINRINEIFQNPHNQSLPGGRKGSGVATIFQVGEGAL